MLLNTSSLSLLSPHSSKLFSVNTHRQVADFSRARTVSRHFSARARIGLRSGVGVGIDAVSTTVKRSFNGKSRRRSELVPCCRRRQRQLAPGMKTNARLASRSNGLCDSDATLTVARRIQLRVRLARWHRKRSKGSGVRRALTSKKTRGHISGRKTLPVAPLSKILI